MQYILLKVNLTKIEDMCCMNELQTTEWGPGEIALIPGPLEIVQHCLVCFSSKYGSFGLLLVSELKEGLILCIVYMHLLENI